MDTFRLLVPSHCGEGLVLLSSLCCSGSRLFYMESALRCTQFQPLGVPEKRGTKSCTCFLCLARQSGSGNQELEGRALPGCGALSPLRGPSLSFCPCQSGACAFCPPHPQPLSLPTPVRSLRPVFRRDPPGGCRPSRISGSLWLETGGLFAIR